MHLVMIGGSDAGISAALRARELNPDADVTVVAADAYPNFSICGIPYYLSGEVTHWRNLAHRTIADLEAAGMWLRLDTPRPQHRRCRPQAPGDITGGGCGVGVRLDTFRLSTGTRRPRDIPSARQPLALQSLRIARSSVESPQQHCLA
jgi:hypothetical protein